MWLESIPFRSEKLYLMDIVEAVDAISKFIGEMAAEEFTRNVLVRSAVAVKLTNIAEAAACVSDGLRNRHPEVGWSAAVEVGTAVLERYYDVDWGAVYDTATRNAPILKEQIARILEEEFPNS